jgi:hypothetical protein
VHELAHKIDSRLLGPTVREQNPWVNYESVMPCAGMELYRPFKSASAADFPLAELTSRQALKSERRIVTQTAVR